jgi:hypothetical protein
MKISYTKEPWSTAYRKNGEGMYSQDVFDSGGETIAEMAWYPVKEGNRTCTNREENAQRIVACVNACQGLSTKGLESHKYRIIKLMPNGVLGRGEKTMQEISDFLWEPIEISNGEVVFSEYPTVHLPLFAITDWDDKPNGYKVYPTKDKSKNINDTKERLIDYLNNCGIGASSKTMLIALLGGTPKEVYAPGDENDFKSCYDILEHFPELDKNIDKVSALNDEWKHITMAWKTYGYKYCREHFNCIAFLCNFYDFIEKPVFDKKTIDSMSAFIKGVKTHE